MSQDRKFDFSSPMVEEEKVTIDLATGGKLLRKKSNQQGFSNMNYDESKKHKKTLSQSLLESQTISKND